MRKALQNQLYKSSALKDVDRWWYGCSLMTNKIPIGRGALVLHDE